MTDQSRRMMNGIVSEIPAGALRRPIKSITSSSLPPASTTDLGRRMFNGIVSDISVTYTSAKPSNVIDIPEFMKTKHRVMSDEHIQHYEQSRISKWGRFKKWFLSLFFESY